MAIESKSFNYETLGEKDNQKEIGAIQIPNGITSVNNKNKELAFIPMWMMESFS